MGGMGGADMGGFNNPFDLFEQVIPSTSLMYRLTSYQDVFLKELTSLPS